ncbi:MULTISPECIES: SLC13 family permease [Kordiimonas]|jgi:di/tricarboxylate transporter|uniref:Di-and tricarboxylate transporter n=1 Tax=Kordiimonas lacus TaxID=637679 RepID=A0A1G7C8P2_9PROT|nr:MULTISPECIES: SLC13 family permease [Kordiimonas]SDE35744.1 Di-and tricarboxylate transporter [Kordiimonas lacus]
MELIEPTIQMWLTFAIVLGAIVAYAYDRIPLEISSITTIAMLLFVFEVLPLVDTSGNSLITTRDLLQGFADPALITIMALLVTGQGLVQTGALNSPARLMVRWGKNYPALVILACLIIVMVISAVMNNTPVVVIFIPILAALADRMGKKSAMVMMPLSFAAILGGNMTKIGSSTNLLAIGAYEQIGGDTIGFFDFTVPGAVLAAVGFFYVILIAPRLLVDRASLAKRMASGGGKQFLFQMELTPDNGLVGQNAIAGMFPGLKEVTVRMIQRGTEKLLPPYDDITLQTGDIVLVAATRSVMTELLNASPELVSSAEGEDVDDKAGERRVIAEAVIAPASRMDGRTLAQTGFRAETGCSVLGVQRRSRMIRAALSALRLEAGDVLLIMGSRTNVLALRDNRDVMLMESSASDVPMQEFAWRALAIFAGVVATAALEIFPIVVAALLGATLMMVTRCLNVRQAARAIDRRVFTIVGAALALGTAMQATGGASWLAHSMIEALMGAPVWVILSGFFLLVAVLTNVLSNNATAVLFTPIAVSVAHELGVPPMPFLLAVIFGANCSFATPMSYQTNLLVMAPGHYRFVDFMRVGTPLIFVVWLTFTLFVPWYYDLL